MSAGIVTRLGYLYCDPCADLVGAQADITVWRDTSPHNVEPCDRCGRILAATEPCPYTVGRRPCIAGAAGHDGPHDWPAA